jgi:hypothetical protein
MSRSGQLDMCCTVEPNCSDLSTRLTGASVIRNRALITCEPSCVPGAARSFFIHVVHNPLGGRGVRGNTEALLLRRRGRGYVAAPKPTSAGRQGPKLRNTWQHRSSPLEEVEPGAMRHVAASELTSAGRRGAELRNTWQRRSSTQQRGEARGHVPRGSTGAHLSKEVRSRAVGHMAAPEPTSAGRCGPKLQLV